MYIGYLFACQIFFFISILKYQFTVTTEPADYTSSLFYFY